MAAKKEATQELHVDGAMTEEAHRSSHLSALRTPEGKKEARVVAGLYGETDWTDEGSVASYFERLGARSDHHLQVAVAAEASGAYRKGRTHRAIAAALSR